MITSDSHNTSDANTHMCSSRGCDIFEIGWNGWIALWMLAALFVLVIFEVFLYTICVVSEEALLPLRKSICN